MPARRPPHPSAPVEPDQEPPKANPGRGGLPFTRGLVEQLGRYLERAEGEDETARAQALADIAALAGDLHRCFDPLELARIVHAHLGRTVGQAESDDPGQGAEALAALDRVADQAGIVFDSLIMPKLYLRPRAWPAVSATANPAPAASSPPRSEKRPHPWTRRGL